VRKTITLTLLLATLLASFGGAAANKPSRTFVILQYHGMLNKDLDHLGANADQGGQLVYELDKAKALGELGHKVIIYARRIAGDRRFRTFDKDRERVAPNVEIRYVRYGPASERRDRYFPKEMLWSYMRQFVEGVAADLQRRGTRPDWLFGAYADGNAAAWMLSQKLGVPYSFTGHSLGGEKYNKLRQDLKNRPEDLDRTYRFSVRRGAEHLALKNAQLITHGSNQERHDQFSGTWYQGAVDVDRDQRFVLMPQGIGTNFDRAQPWSARDQQMADAFHRRWQREIDPARHDKDGLLFWSRFNDKKNPSGLVREYAESPVPQQLYNLVIVNPDSPNNPEMKKIQKMVASYRAKGVDLRGKVAVVRPTAPMVSHHPGFSAVLRSLYRATGKRWVYVNPALHEPAGRMNFEAQFAGVVAASTDDGGPKDLVRDGQTGMLFNVHKPGEMGRVLARIGKDPKLYDRLLEGGYRQVKHEYSWFVTLPPLLERIEAVIAERAASAYFWNPTRANRDRLTTHFSALDDTVFRRLENALRSPQTKGLVKAVERIIKRELSSLDDLSLLLEHAPGFRTARRRSELYQYRSGVPVRHATRGAIYDFTFVEGELKRVALSVTTKPTGPSTATRAKREGRSAFTSPGGRRTPRRDRASVVLDRDGGKLLWSRHGKKRQAPLQLGKGGGRTI
jgi:sucrose-phosphate synthase